MLTIPGLCNFRYADQQALFRPNSSLKRLLAEVSTRSPDTTAHRPKPSVYPLGPTVWPKRRFNRRSQPCNHNRELAAGGRPLALSTADGTSLPTYGGQRPNIVGTPRRNHGHDWIDNYFTDPTVFQLPPLYALGNAPRALGTVRTPWSFNADMALAKQFSLRSVREGMNLEFRLEAQNALNHPVFGAPNTAVDDPSFGTVSYTSNQPRQVQLGLRINF